MRDVIQLTGRGAVSRSAGNPAGHPRSTGDVSPAPTAHTGRAPRVPAHLRDAGREVWRTVWAAGDGAYNPSTDQFVIQRYCERGQLAQTR